jgi:hypothetical protein
MCLDLRRLLAFRSARFDHVRIERALRQKARRFAVDLDRVGFALEQADELLSDELTLLLRINYAAQRRQIFFHRVDSDQSNAQRALKRLDDLFRFALAQHASIDKDAR